MDYERLLREKEIKMIIWGKESVVVIDKNIELPRDFILDKLFWIEEHRDEIITFALAAEDFLDGINAEISKAIARKGKYKLLDGTVLKNTLEEESLRSSIFVNSVYFDEDDFCIDLATRPDYFGGHLLGIIVSNDKNELEYDGMNG